MIALTRNGQHNAPELHDIKKWSPLESSFRLDPWQSMFASCDYGFAVSRTDQGYEVEIPVPGLNASNLEVTFKEHVLSVNSKNPSRPFSRSLSIPEDVNSDSIAASIADGMLRINLERHPEAQPRRIVVSGPDK